MSSSQALFHAQYKASWRERLFYQYRLYVDNLLHLNRSRYIAFTCFILINTLILVFVGIALVLEFTFQIAPLDMLFSGLGIVVCLAFIIFLLRLQRRNRAMVQVVEELEHELPPSLIQYTYPHLNYVAKYLQYALPWLFCLMYIFLMLYLHPVLP